MWALLYVLSFLLPAQAAVGQTAGERLQALAAADWASAKPAADGWPDLSPGALRNREAQDRATLEELHRVPRASLRGEDRTLYDLFERQLSRRLEQFRLRLYLTPFWEDVRFGPPIPWLSGALLERAPGSLAEYEARLKKLETFPAYVQQYISLMREARQARMLPSKESARQAISGIAGLLGGGLAYKPPALLPIPGADSYRARLQEAARNSIRERVLPALREFHDVLTREYLPACPESASLMEWPNGAEVYRELVRRSTTTELDPKQIHELGLREVARICEAMAEAIAKTGHKGSLGEFLAAARSDPRFYFSNEDELLAAYRAAVARIEPLVPKVAGRLPVRGLRVEPVRYGGPAAVYKAPSAGEREATVVVDVAKLEIRPKFEIIPLMLHEGMPGHHLQFGLALEARGGGSDTISEFEQRLRRSEAFTEGWALYAESLGEELGLYTDPYDKFGQLSMDLVRAVRVVIDTGVHAYGWSAAKAKEYFIAQTGKAEAAADLEVSRTMRPGSQLAYKVGEQRIRAMRDRAAKTLGPRFDRRSFHDVLLRWGPLPLDVLERKLDECLKEPACAVAFQPVP